MNGKSFTALRELLEREAQRRDDPSELSHLRPDPLLVAREQKDDRAVLLCALFGYGNAGKIVRFLENLDFSLLDAEEREIREKLEGYYYRFQSSEDVVQIFVTLRRIGRGTLKEGFLEGYARNRRVIEGVFSLIRRLESVNSYESRGYRFLIGRVPKDERALSPYKRWMMFLRWMVRRDALDLGRWREIERSDLVIPLDTHTFRVGHRLGLLRRKSHDWKAALELTSSLRKICPEDPVRYDFALYRLGQENVEL